MTTPRDILHQYEIKPRKKLGQSFLVDLNTIKKIVLAARLLPQDVVVEIGAGIGVLTREILNITGRITAVEIDPRLVETLKDQLKSYPGAQVHSGDILKFDFSSISYDYQSKIKVIGNVPYHISSPVVFHLLSSRSVLSDFTLMLQKEVVDRLVSLPDRKSYGVPSVLLQMYVDMERLFDVSASCFHPRPKVESSIIRGTFRDKPRIELTDELLFVRVVKASFASRRKMLVNNLKNARFLNGWSDTEIRNALYEAGIDGKRRGETLSVEEYGNLSNVLKNRLTNPQ